MIICLLRKTLGVSHFMGCGLHVVFVELVNSCKHEPALDVLHGPYYLLGLNLDLFGLSKCTFKGLIWLPINFSIVVFQFEIHLKPIVTIHCSI